MFGIDEDVGLWRVGTSLPLDLESVRGLGVQIANLIDMNIEQSMEGVFPKKGKGGHGIQIYWEWTESFLVISTWPKLGFLRVYVASCKPFLPVMVSKFLEATVGPVLKFEYVGI